jgi:hypothetical protein
VSKEVGGRPGLSSLSKAHLGQRLAAAHGRLGPERPQYAPSLATVVATGPIVPAPSLAICTVVIWMPSHLA